MSIFSRAPQGTIRRRILSIVEERINDAESKYREGCNAFDREYIETVQAASVIRNDKSEQLADSLVKDVLAGNI